MTQWKHMVRVDGCGYWQIELKDVPPHGICAGDYITGLPGGKELEDKLPDYNVLAEDVTVAWRCVDVHRRVVVYCIEAGKWCRDHESDIADILIKHGWTVVPEDDDTSVV